MQRKIAEKAEKDAAAKEKKERKAARDEERKRAEKFKDLSWKYGLGGAGLFIGLACIYSLMTISASSISTLQLHDTEALKEVFFGGDPWLVACANENVTVGAGFVAAAKKLSVTSNVKFGSIDCAGKLPSNRTFFQRFKLLPVNFTASKPAGYLFANGDPPQQIPEKYMTDPKKIAAWTEKYSKPSMKEVAWQKTFDATCLKRDSCVMLHTKGKYKNPPEWLEKLMQKTRGVKFVTINRSLHKTSFDDKVKAPRKEDVPRLAVLTRKKASDSEKDKYSVTPYRGEWTESAVSSFVNSVAKKGEKTKDTAELEDTPWFDVPPKGAKNQAANKNKEWRDRQRAQQGNQNTGGGEGKSTNSEESKADGRLRAAQEAEAQLSDDDDVVVSDIDDDEDDGLV